MIDFSKSPWEEVYRYFEFARDDGMDGLVAGETIASATVTAIDSNGNDKSDDLIDEVTHNGTRVTYRLRGGDHDNIYTITVRIVTTRGQQIEGTARIYVI